MDSSTTDLTNISETPPSIEKYVESMNPQTIDSINQFVDSLQTKKQYQQEPPLEISEELNDLITSSSEEITPESLRVIPELTRETNLNIIDNFSTPIANYDSTLYFFF